MIGIVCELCEKIIIILQMGFLQNNDHKYVVN